MANNNDYIRFDWAIKRILRDKANFGVLEGLMTVLIGEGIKIQEIIESESNSNSHEDKYNRVDVKAKTSSGEIILVEVQLGKESFFMPRILFGVSKAITEQLKRGMGYENIKKVYSISVLYFDLGEGEDYAYHGKFNFKGMTNPSSELKFSKAEAEEVLPKGKMNVISPKDVFPEFFLLRVNQFNEVAKTPIEEWMEYLKDGVIKEDTTVPGLQEAREKLNYMRMTDAERMAYEDYMISVHAAKDVILTAKADGFAEGRAEGHAVGRAEGRAEGRVEGRAEGIEETNFKTATRMKQKGFSVDDIAEITGLSKEQIASL
ncbi:MAG: Rpn family recombination-promoting nuclease/putative transposase [Prevotella sp.]|nr:Rpn family recombination-promoting nuclease/putative transposase [Prevotella sp.]